jgi:hypothetical protein
MGRGISLPFAELHFYYFLAKKHGSTAIAMLPKKKKKSLTTVITDVRRAESEGDNLPSTKLVDSSIGDANNCLNPAGAFLTLILPTKVQKMNKKPLLIIR